MAWWNEAGEISQEVWDSIRVKPELDFHDKGCVKRYDAEPDNAAMCECEKRRAAATVADSASGDHRD